MYSSRSTSSERVILPVWIPKILLLVFWVHHFQDFEASLLLKIMQLVFCLEFFSNFATHPKSVSEAWPIYKPALESRLTTVASCLTCLSILVIGQFCETGASLQRQQQWTWQWQGSLCRWWLYRTISKRSASLRFLFTITKWIYVVISNLKIGKILRVSAWSEVFLPSFGLFGCHHIWTPEKNRAIFSQLCQSLFLAIWIHRIRKMEVTILF